MANWSNPTLTSLYTDLLTELKARDTDLALQFDGTTSTNLTTNTIRWDSSANRWKKWNGTSWAELTSTYALTDLSTTGAASIGTTLTVTGAAALNGGGTSTTPVTGDNSTAIATTAYVKAQAYATLASPALTGTPTAPTAAASTNTTQVATTSFVIGQGASVAPLMAGTAAVGTSLLFARQDHIHPTDTSRAPLASPAFTGTALLGTATALTNAYAISTALTPAFQIEGNTGNAAALSITRHTSAAANLLLQRGVTGTPVADTQALGQINFNGFDGTNYFNAALIRAVVDGTPGTGSMPGRLSFQTTPTGSTTPVERLRLDTAGQILAASLGTAALPVWSFTGDPNTGFWSPSADAIAASTGGTEVARITADNYLRMAASTGGIQFNGDTAAANALDDYEEGTFTPTIAGVTTPGTGTYSTQVGRYTKISNRVFYSLTVTWSAHTGTGNMDVDGLPFTAQGTGGNSPPPSVNSSNLTVPANAYPTALKRNNSTAIRMYSVVTGGGAITGLALDTAATLYISGHYETAT